MTTTVKPRTLRPAMMAVPTLIPSKAPPTAARPNSFSIGSVEDPATVVRAGKSEGIS
jgi:hypothetical protein